MKYFCVVPVLWTLLSAVACADLSYIKNLLHFTDNDALMQRIVVHNKTGDVYVGARNTLYVLDKNLSLRQKASTGPELDNVLCPHPTVSCDHERLQMDNDNKILDIYYTPSADLLFSCGTLYQGMCRAMHVNNINIYHWIGNINDTYSHIAGRDSTIGFFAPGPTPGLSLYSALTYDDRPLKYFPMSVSSKIPVWRHGNISFTYSHETQASRTGVNFNDVYKKLYKVNYVYGFSYAGFSYFVTTQRIAPEAEVVETRLVRICQNDLEFFSYTEMPLRCQRGLDVFNLATAAYLGPAGIQLKRKLKMSAEVNEILYISFGMTVPDHGILLDRAKGSVVCSFPMDQIVHSITNTTRDCFEAQPRMHLLKHVVGVDKKCDKYDMLVVTDDFCGSGLNPYIGSRETTPGGFRFYADHYVTSLAVTLQFGKTIAVMGTHNGDVIKEMLDRRTVQPLYVINIGKDSDGNNHSIESSNAFDHTHGNIYFLTGNKVVKFPVGSCSLYKDCGSCLTSEDPLSCGWCGDHCAHLEECGTIALLSRNSCPPVIYHLEPLRGPTDGGTEITILGDNFGSSQSGESNSNIKIKVAGVDCGIVIWGKEKLRCKTNPVVDEISGPVSVWVEDTSWSAGQFDMNGTTLSLKNFSYIIPKLYGIYPSYGPLSGGTNLTLFGKNLDIGSNHVITTAGVPCANYNISQNMSWCITGHLPEGTVDSRGAIEINIDLAIVKPEVTNDFNFKENVKIQKEFRFLPDPDISNIHPHTALVSGATNLSVYGVHLNSIAYPKIIVIVTSSLTGETYEKQMPCHLYDATGFEMICPTPSIDIPGLHAPTDRAPLVAHVAFKMDGVQKLRELPIRNSTLSQLLYYPDPVFDNPLQTVNNATHLEIKGSYLDLALTPRDVKVFIDDDSICNVTLLTKESLFCIIPPLESLKSVNGSTHTVQISIGHLKFPLAYVKFASDSGYFAGLLTSIIVCILVVLCACVIYSIYYKVCNKRDIFKCLRKKKTCHTLSISFQREDEAGNRRRQERNDYQDFANRSLVQRPSISIPEAACNVEPESPPESISDVEDEVVRLLKSENILIQRDFLTLGEIIGEGYFGIVYKGKLNLQGKGEKITVAVKTLQNSITRGVTESFLQEGLMMKDFHHHNVLTLIGVCFEQDGSPMIIIPYMKYGDLLSFIRDENQSFTIKDFMTFGVDIAAGMHYLSNSKFVHRDLAARNCMLAEDYTVKVADFGLSRDIYERDYYCSDNKKKLPIKWMAPESIEQGTYTTKSDVWSYGVVLWELFTRGFLPYPDVDNWDLIRYLKTGRRMLQPCYCPDILYQIMIRCWDFDPKKRPTFAQLEKEVKDAIKTLEMPKRKVSVNVTYVNCPDSFSEASTSQAKSTV